MSTTETVKPFVCMVTADDGTVTEFGRYDTATAARRAGKRQVAAVNPTVGFEVIGAEEVVTAAVEAAVEATLGAEAPAAEDVQAVRAPARKLTLAERRALVGPLHTAARKVLAKVAADLDAGKHTGEDDPLRGVTARDAEACIALWMWYLPNGGAEWGDQLA